MYLKGSQVEVLFLSLKIVIIIANIVDPDEMQHHAAFHLGLHCLPKYPFRDFLNTKVLGWCSFLNKGLNIVVFVFNIPPTDNVIWRRGHSLVSSDRLVKPGIKPVTPG